MYAVIPYAIAQGATEIPWALAQTLLFSCIAYFMIHFDFTAGKLIPWGPKSPLLSGSTAWPGCASLIICNLCDSKYGIAHSMAKSCAD